VATNVLFDGNYARYTGGAVQIRGSPSVVFKNCKFANNTAGMDGMGGNGGAIFVEHDVQAVWDDKLNQLDAQLHLNRDMNQPMETIGVVHIHDTTFTNNKAYGYGGAFASLNTFTYMQRCDGTGNYAGIGGGFAAMLHTNGSLVMRGTSASSKSKVMNNKASDAGGAFYSVGVQEGDPARACAFYPGCKACLEDADRRSKKKKEAGNHRSPSACSRTRRTAFQRL
jgi:predicted outer membrane repeat protein